MSASSNRRGSTTSDTPVTSPLARPPKFSPPSSQNVSPPRRPLHERSGSHSNQFSGPTIRLVDDPGSTNIYSKHPFPSQPSQILPPRNAPGYAFEHRGRRVSDHGTVANAVAKLEASHTLVPAPLQQQKKAALRHSASTSTSEADTFVASSFSPSTVRFSQDTTPPSSPGPPSLVAEKPLEVLEEVPSPRQRSTIRAVTPSNSSLSTSSASGTPSESRALTPKASAASLASPDPADSSSAHINAAPSSKGTSSNLATRPLSTKGIPQHTPTHSLDKKKQASSSNTASWRPTSSAASLAFSDITSVSEEPSQPSPTLHEARTATLASGVRVNYPAIRAPSGNSLWAESQELPSISSRMNSHPSQVHQWSSQLSTIHSESERDSRSIERGSYAFSARSQSQGEYASPGRPYMPRRRGTVGSTSSSENHSSGNNSSNATASSSAVPLPLFSPITRPSQDERHSDEVHDTISPLQSPPLRMKRSGYLRRHDSDARSTRSSTSSRPSSSQSDLSAFISNTIPGWARAYYRRGERVSLGAPESVSDSSDSIRLTTGQSVGRTNTPSDGMPLSIYRPRNRPHERMSYPETLSISDDSSDQNVYVLGPQRRLTEPITPRLRQDRRSQARLSAWKAPSFDENLGSMLFSRQNRQIALFCLGFLFPFAWMIAACLPLPPNPDTLQEPTPSQMDVENRFTRDFGPVEDKSYQKARWWRNLNRVMSGLGTLLVGVIIALAILASRMK